MMTQTVIDREAEAAVQPMRAAITVEMIAYTVVIVLALVLRAAELDTVPLTDMEARQALASWRVIHPDAPGGQIIPESPILFLLNNITFSTLGASEMTARILTVLAGVLLVCSPVLFREMLGRTRAFLFSVFLACSPILLVASRSGSPTVWALLFAVLGLWALWRYLEMSANRVFYGSMVVVLAAGTVFLAEPGGLVLALILVVAGAGALWLMMLDAPEHKGLPGNEYLHVVRARFVDFPWTTGLMMALLTVVAVSTGFMLYPTGMSAIGELVGGALRGISTPRSGAVAAFPLVTLLFYEPFLLVFAMTALWLMARRGALGFTERLLAVWIVLGGLVSLLYAGGGAEHALWLVIPLAGLASYTATALLTSDDSGAFWGFRLADDGFANWQPVPRWGKWLLAVAMVILLVIFSIHLQVIGRSMMTFPPGTALADTLNLLLEPQYVVLLRGLIWVILAVIFIVIGYLLAASAWGNMTAAQGGALGLLVFVLVTSLGSGWNVAVANAANPVELWYGEATSRDVFLLRDTITDFARRETGGFSMIPITAVGDEGGIVRDDGVLAWTLRDYINMRYVASVDDARTDKLILLGSFEDPQAASPALGGSYVGQSFVISRWWDQRSISLPDWLAWWTQRQVRSAAVPSKKVVLWVRQDVFDGVQFDERGLR